MIPQRILSGVCEITTGAFSVMQRPPVYTGEAAALNVQVKFKFQGEDYTIPPNTIAEMYLKYPNTNLMTVAVEMAIDGNTASGILSEKQTGMAGYPLLVIQLTDTETSSLIVACATAVKVSDVRGDLVIDTRPPSPSEIVYIGRSPYIDHTTNRWMEWSIDQNAYVDTGVELGTATRNYVDAEFAKKADKETTYTKNDVDELVTPKADKTYVDNQLDLKADKATTYTKTEVDSLVQSVFRYKGTKATVAEVEALTQKVVGDMWFVTADSSEYAWNGTKWEKLGPIIDLTPYLLNISIAGLTINAQSTTITKDQLLTALGVYTKAEVDAMKDDLQNAIDTKADILYRSADTPADIVTFEDGADDLPVKKLSVAIEPVQDLHGYDHPWPAGGGVNKFACGDAVGSIPDSAYGLTVVCDGETETITISGTPTWTAAGKKLFRIISTRSGSYYGDAPVTHDYSGMHGKFFVVSKSQNITNIDAHSSFNHDGTIGINLTSTDTAAVSIVLKLCIYEGDTAPTEWTPYSNICPITGFDSVKVTRTGKNLLRYPYMDTTKTVGSLTLTDNGDGTITANGSHTAVAYFNMFANNQQSALFLKAGTYKIPATRNSSIQLNVYYLGGKSVTTGNTERTFTLSKDSYIYCSLRYEANASFSNVTVKPMLLRSTETATEYEPYHGETYDITLPTEAGTVYGGQLTVHNDGTGELVVTKNEINLGALTWYYNNTYNFFASNAISSGKNGSYLICSQYEYGGYKINSEMANAKDKSLYNTDSLKLVKVKDTSYSDELTFKTAMSGVQLVYELETPVTYTLTAPQVRTLLGHNNIWADTGEIDELVYMSNGDNSYELERLDQRITNTQTIITPREGPRATANHAVGEVFIVQDKLYKATDSIASGEMLIEGSNVTKTTIIAVIAEQIQAAMNQ